MKPNCPIRVVSLLVLASAASNAQVARQVDIPLRNWATPLYWQANQVEREATSGGLPVKAAPQLQFSANAVSTNALTLVAITPCRLVDTRGASAGFNGISPFSGPSIPALGTIAIPVQSPTEASANTSPAPCGVIPSIAQAYSFNLTVVPSVSGTAVDYVSLWPAGSAQPFVSTLDDPQGAIVSNAVIVPAGPTSGPGYGGVSVYNYGPATTDVIVDMNGYFAAPTDVNGNTAIGVGTLALDTTGAGNTASGYGALQLNTAGSDNTASGYGALVNNSIGNDNTASGYQTLAGNTTGNGNTASGQVALENNTTGSYNTASGFQAIQYNTTGAENTANGAYALQNNLTGGFNTASGFQALQANGTGAFNTAAGYQAMQSSCCGSYNTAVGYLALGGYSLFADNFGNYNTASGAQALQSNGTGTDNTANGSGALQYNSTGSNNTANGFGALQNNTTGANNIAIGYDAAIDVSGSNSNNIHIGNLGASGDIGVIKIGIEGTQSSAYIAGISGAGASGGAAVYVTSSGQLGTVLSSRRFKEQIADMGDTSSKLLQLRPVNFFYKPQYDDGSHLLQYGLIAEEVAKVYPEMVAYDKDGQILTVKYQLLAPMLLNEVQKQAAQLQLQQEENRKLEDRLAALEALLSAARPASSQ